MKALDIPPSTAHNIIKAFRISGEIPACNEQDWWSILDANLQVLRRRCIGNRHDSVLGVAAWAQIQFLKSLSVNTVNRAIHKCKLKLYHAKKKRCRLIWVRAYLKWTEAKWKTVLWVDESKSEILFWTPRTTCPLYSREEGPSSLSSVQKLLLMVL